MSILNPVWLVAAFVLVILYIFLQTTQRRDDWYRLIKPEVLDYLDNSGATHTRRLPAILVAGITAVALASPSLTRKDNNTFTHAEGWFVVADLSRSMTLEDIAPTRIAAMRNTIQAISRQSQSRALALVIFAGDAFMITPPAFDKQHFNQQVNLLEHGLVPLDGSNLTRALSLVTSVIDSSQVLNARVLIMGDTGGFTTKAQAAVARLASLDHRTDVILYGTADSSSSNAVFNLKAATDMANAGKGTVLQSDVFGTVSIERLELDNLAVSNNSLIPSGILLLRWQSLSHWILLLALPLVLLLFRRERR